MGSGDIDLNVVIVAGHRPLLAKPAPGLPGFARAAPEPALRFGERTPASGHGTENAADRLLGRGAWVCRDMMRVRDLPVARALIDYVPALAGFRIGFFHRSLNAFSLLGLPCEAGRGLPQLSIR